MRAYPDKVNTEHPTTKSGIDIHVHILGDGSSGTGCFLKLRSPYHRFLAAYILRDLGLPPETISPGRTPENGLDRVYVSTLKKLVADSSLAQVVILAHELVYDDKGVAHPERGSFYVPNDHVLTLARENPEFIAGISIHPARADALDALDECAAKGARLLKLLPNCQNVNCNDPRYTKFWTRVSELKIPFLAHTGGELSVPVTQPAYANPEVLRLPLECGVTVIAAHASTSSHPLDVDYLPVLRSMMERYPKLYTDVSALCSPLRSAHLRRILKDPTLLERVVHGSDLPIPISGTWPWLRGLISWQERAHAHSTSNPLERDVRLKKSMGFPQETFHRVEKLLRPMAP